MTARSSRGCRCVTPKKKKKKIVPRWIIITNRRPFRSVAQTRPARNRIENWLAVGKKTNRRAILKSVVFFFLFFFFFCAQSVVSFGSGPARGGTGELDVAVSLRCRRLPEQWTHTQHGIPKSIDFFRHRTAYTRSRSRRGYFIRPIVLVNWSSGIETERARMNFNRDDISSVTIIARCRSPSFRGVRQPYTFFFFFFHSASDQRCIVLPPPAAVMCRRAVRRVWNRPATVSGGYEEKICGEFRTKLDNPVENRDVKRLSVVWDF